MKERTYDPTNPIDVRGLEAVPDTDFVSRFLGYAEDEDKMTPEERAQQEAEMEDVDEKIAAMPMLNFPKSEDKAALDAFFTDDVIRERVLFCPRVAVDETDSWGVYGDEPGFIVVLGMVYKGTKTLADQLWLQGRSLHAAEGIPILAINSTNEGFPRDKFRYISCSFSRNRAIYNYLAERIAVPKKMLEVQK